MEFPSKNVIPRYVGVAVLLTLAFVGILVMTTGIMFFQRDYWEAVSRRFVRENVKVPPVRGNIYADGGELLAGSLPEYRLYMDFMSSEKKEARRLKDQARRDSLLHCKADSIAEGMHRIFPAYSTAWFRQRLMEGRSRESRNWLLLPEKVSYIKYKEVKALPLFRLASYRGGFHVEAFNRRANPFGSLALRTLGDIYGSKDSARCGLELALDSLLRGKPGITHRQKVMNKYLNITDVLPTDGYDVETTLDVDMQDLAEKSLRDGVEKWGARVGVAIVMEVSTGDVKAIVNLSLCGDGVYREVYPHAVADLLEPGSVFKPVSFLVAFDDGKIKMNDYIDTGCGVYEMYGRKMKDHNFRNGGYGMLSVPECLEFSSNIGVSRLIDKYYHSCPEKFVEGVYRTGIHEDLHIPVPGYASPRIRMPKKDGSNWSKTALPWMSIGYETQVPPISTLTFYNGVANNGRMMRPRFVKAIRRDGEVIETFDPVVVREHMASKEAIANLQTCLNWVVSKGLGKRAGSPYFPVSGKTGTAQIWSSGGFSSSYLISFAGFFPSDRPLYSCIVCMQKSGAASGGTMCGPVFHHISEGIMARHMHPSLRIATDTLAPRLPRVKGGNRNRAEQVLQALLIPFQTQGATGELCDESTLANGKISLPSLPKGKGIPDVRGMGLRDAVFLLEKTGLRVRAKGRGHVTRQQPQGGEKYRKGQTVTITLEEDGDKQHSVPAATETPATMQTADSLKTKLPSDSAAGHATQKENQKKKI